MSVAGRPHVVPPTLSILLDGRGRWHIYTEPGNSKWHIPMPSIPFWIQDSNIREIQPFDRFPHLLTTVHIAGRPVVLLTSTGIHLLKRCCMPVQPTANSQILTLLPTHLLYRLIDHAGRKEAIQDAYRQFSTQPSAPPDQPRPMQYSCTPPLQPAGAGYTVVPSVMHARFTSSTGVFYGNLVQTVLPLCLPVATYQDAKTGRTWA